MQQACVSLSLEGGMGVAFDEKDQTLLVCDLTQLENTMVQRFYPAVLERGAKGTFAIWFPDFPRCVAGATSQEQAMDRAQNALAQAVDVLAERDRVLPEPTPFEKIVLPKDCDFVAFFAVGVVPPDPSERVNIYLSESLIARADRRAAELGMSRSSFFGFAVTTVLLSGPAVALLPSEYRGPRSQVKRAEGLRRKKA